jgi:hypothetical protein
MGRNQRKANRMKPLLIAVAVWLLVSIPVGLFLCRLLARQAAAIEAADNAIRDRLQADLARALRREAEAQFVLDVEAWRHTQPAE